jgi:hypothetical protein
MDKLLSTYNNLLSTFASDFNLRRYIVGTPLTDHDVVHQLLAQGHLTCMVRRCRLTQVDHRLTPC